MELTPTSYLSRSGGPSTSAEAAESLGESRQTMMKNLLSAFQDAPEGLTSEEASNICGYSAEHGAWKRVSDLRNSGYITPKLVDGKEVTRVGSSNRKQRVLVVTQDKNK